jgi:hypothetical protein
MEDINWRHSSMDVINVNINDDITLMTTLMKTKFLQPFIIDVTEILDQIYCRSFVMLCALCNYVHTDFW